MSFLLRIFFSGLIALVPSKDGKELTVLLLDVQHGYALSDGTTLPPHLPMLLARAGKCAGDCATGDRAIAEMLFPDSSANAAELLSAALLEGTAWKLSGADLSIVQPGTPAPLDIRRNLRRNEAGQPAALPQSSAEREDFSWVAEMGKIDPTAGEVDADVLAPQPRQGLIAARLRLRSGKVFSYRLLGQQNQVTPVHFQTIEGDRVAVAYTQALADWVEADIEITGDAVQIVDQSFDGKQKRAVELSPHNGQVEVALLNFAPHATHAAAAAPGPGKHFEIFYELSKTRPANQRRPVPFAGTRTAAEAPATVAWSTVHPQQQLWSDLLAALKLGDPRGVYDQTICPLVGFGPPGP
jgi:hypothetical protein